MPTVVFTSNLKRHLDCPPQQVSGGSLHDVLKSIFSDNPKLVSYIVDDQFRIRKHILISIDNELITDRIHLTDKVTSESKIYIFQALSGG
ncbi:MAG: MoaD/ThiS family protein [Kangiellaceae bacterium]|jgi:sulfur-carrier protein